jgi:hypothetical protein
VDEEIRKLIIKAAKKAIEDGCKFSHPRPSSGQGPRLCPNCASRLIDTLVSVGLSIEEEYEEE